MKYEEISEKIIKAFYSVYNTLGYGFMERVYENALMIEFRKVGLLYENQVPIKVLYEGDVVGDYIADFVVEGKIIVEIKAIIEFSGKEENQLLNYLTATDKEVGLLLNFGEKAQVKRKIYDNGLKKYLEKKGN
ncbi:GxxExxY protein [archaeon]|jgi:GxxExxY protein|nr:GxxExxY protein [archaeon]MBT7128423.1 GxxExxY protein [archaeon]